jgi:D-xylose 1-dehydrogenase (NADP+, D-xylono-1,5-lactone-forming)
VASRGGDRAERFAAEHCVAHAFGSYVELLASDVVDAVYVALPPSLHAEWTVRALEAGKHVLCEKPFVLSEADADRAFDTAEAAGLVLVEGSMYRLHPQPEVLEQRLAEGVVGGVRLVRTALSIATAQADIRRSRALGGGALHDLGCYCLSGIRLVTGEPVEMYAAAVLDDGAVDLALGATLRMPAGVIAQFDVGLLHTRRDELEVVGSDGALVVPDPVGLPGRPGGDPSRLRGRGDGGGGSAWLRDRPGGGRLPDGARPRLRGDHVGDGAALWAGRRGGPGPGAGGASHVVRAGAPVPVAAPPTAAFPA